MIQVTKNRNDRKRQSNLLPCSPAPLLLCSLVLTLTACTTTTLTPIVETVVVPGPTTVVTATPTPAPEPGPATLVVCQGAEPETLYLYGGAQSARHVHEAIYDGPIDHRSFDFQPVILAKMPTLEDGDAYFDIVTVQPGEWVVDINGQPVELAAGVQVFAGHSCLDATNPDCVVTVGMTNAIQIEQMVVSWQLIEGISWSDGQPVTADDSVYSYELACDPDTPSSKYLCDRTASYTAAGERAVVWRGLPGYVDDLYFLNFFSPLPRHLWQEHLHYGAADLLTAPESARTPLGWGPFVITGWTQGEEITLERNPHYFRAAEGLPQIDRLVVRFSRDTNELVARLLAGECDLAVRDGELEPLMPLLAAAQEQGLVELVSTPSDIWEHLEFGIVPVSGYDRPDWFLDPRVRQGIAHCIDRQTMMDEVAFGMGQVAESYIPPGHPLYDDQQMSHWAYDPEAGQALLAEAGWLDEDDDGVLEAVSAEDVRDGTLFRVNLLVVQGDSNQEAIARIIRSNLADCGIQVELEAAPAWDFFADGPSGPLFGRQFDMAIFAWYNDVEPPCGLYLTEQIPDQANWGLPNASGFSSIDYDAACLAALNALPGSYEYDNFHHQAARIFSEQLPALPLFWRPRVVVTRPGVVGLILDPSEESELWGIESVGLAPAAPIETTP